jgi:hypothetical protein
MAKLKYITYKNYTQKENKTRLNLDNASCHSLQNTLCLSFSINKYEASKTVKQFYASRSVGAKTYSSHRKEIDKKVF